MKTPPLPESFDDSDLDQLLRVSRMIGHMHPDFIDAVTTAMRHRIAAQIELQEGPGRFL
jgi:hypothetical protein